MGNFKKGLFFGSLLGAGLMWLNVTPKGREMKAKLLAYAEPMYNELKENIKKLEGPTKEMYEALVERAVEEIAAKKEMAAEMKIMLVKELQKRWVKLEKELKKSK